ncbi:MAG: glycosyltransferase [Bacteroidales bacterium]|nr:glycosyltransferase [Bacteroidales bacterium]
MNKNIKKILYIQHCGVFGGSSRSLLEMINAFPENVIKPYLIIPNGTSKTVFKNNNIDTIGTVGITQFDNYKGYRWFAVLRELFFLIPTFYVILRAKYKWKDINIVHINDANLLIPVLFAKLLLKKPIVVHARFLNRASGNSCYYRIYKYFFSKYVDIVIPIDKTVEKSHSLSNKTHVIHNGFDTQKKIDTNENEFKKIPNRKLTVAMLGNFLKIKGHCEFIEAAKIICFDKKLDINFVLIGDNPKYSIVRKIVFKLLGISADLKEKMINIVKKYSLNKNVHFLGTIMNINTILPTIDVLCFPSHLNAVGRPVFEAGFYRKPSIVAIENPLEDTIIDRITGICIKEKDVMSLVKGIEYFYYNPKKMEEMGEKAYELSNRNFNAKKNAKKMDEVYRSLINNK